MTDEKNETKVEAIVYTMIEGQVTELKYNEDIFAIKKKEITLSSLFEQPTKEDPETKHLPPNTIGYCKNYGTYIKRPEHDKVLRIIKKYNGLATNEMLVAETGIKKNRMTAILRWMKDEKEIKPVYTEETLCYVCKK